MNERVYVLSPLFYTFRDAADDHRIERLEFHVKSGDYFPMLATILGFVEETIAQCGKSELAERQYTLLKDVKKDLTHLHQKYEIKKKD
ncbi:MAG: hypothetical protein AAB440_01405 [Patescibacteria group bacterium]